ncbi:hypothetical protein FRC03_008736 [Tulasnella sp. 419]|nr:hypothetical protein FRC03_008736 [Tulasnella sp. 419]
MPTLPVLTTPIASFIENLRDLLSRCGQSMGQVVQVHIEASDLESASLPSSDGQSFKYTLVSIFTGMSFSALVWSINADKFARVTAYVLMVLSGAGLVAIRLAGHCRAKLRRDLEEGVVLERQDIPPVMRRCFWLTIMAEKVATGAFLLILLVIFGYKPVQCIF